MCMMPSSIIVAGGALSSSLVCLILKRLAPQCFSFTQMLMECQSVGFSCSSVIAGVTELSERAFQQIQAVDPELAEEIMQEALFELTTVSQRAGGNEAVGIEVLRGSRTRRRRARPYRGRAPGRSGVVLEPGATAAWLGTEQLVQLVQRRLEEAEVDELQAVGRLHLEEGPGGSWRVQDEVGDFLVACDGAASACRDVCLGDDAPQYAGRAMWQGMLDAGTVPAAPGHVFNWRDDGGDSGNGVCFSLAVLKDGSCAWHASAPWHRCLSELGRSHSTPWPAGGPDMDPDAEPFPLQKLLRCMAALQSLGPGVAALLAQSAPENVTERAVYRRSRWPRQPPSGGPRAAMVGDAASAGASQLCRLGGAQSVDADVDMAVSLARALHAHGCSAAAAHALYQDPVLQQRYGSPAPRTVASPSGAFLPAPPLLSLPLEGANCSGSFPVAADGQPWTRAQAGGGLLVGKEPRRVVFAHRRLPQRRAPPSQCAKGRAATRAAPKAVGMLAC